MSYNPSMPPPTGAPYGSPQLSATPQPKKSRKHLIGYPATALIALMIGIGAGGSSASTTQNLAAPEVPTTVTERVSEPDPEQTVTATVTAPPVTVQAKPVAPPKPAVVAATLVEGMNQIGVDAPAGRYKTTVPDDSWGCYWERDRDDKGGFSSIIANENLEPGARGSVTVRKGEFFKSSGCGTWTKVS